MNDSTSMFTRIPLMTLAAGLPIAMIGCAVNGQTASEQSDSHSASLVQAAIQNTTNSYNISHPASRPNPYLTANCTAWETEGTLSSNEAAHVETFDNTFATQPIASESFGSSETPRVASSTPSNRSMTMFGEFPSRGMSTGNGFDSNASNTANVRRVTFAEVGADFDPAVTRDGTRIVFASTQHRPTADIYIKDAYSRTVTRLTDDPAQDMMPAVSPDGSFVAFSSDRGGAWNLYMMPTTGGNPVRLTNESTHDLHPSWSPDGSRLVFSRFGEMSNRWELWVMDVASPAGLQFIGYGLFPEWCPMSGTGQDGTDRIAFQRSRERGDRSFSVWTVDYSSRTGAAGRETEVVSSSAQALINPSWSPDGEFLLYASVDNSQASPETISNPDSSSLWMIGSDGRGAVQFVSGPTVDLMPTWGPNNHVFFVSNRSGSENLWSIEVGESVKTANAQRLGALMSPYATVPTDEPGFNSGN